MESGRRSGRGIVPTLTLAAVLILAAFATPAQAANDDIYGWFDTTVCGAGEDYVLLVNARAADGLVINRGGPTGSMLPGTEPAPYGGYPGGYWTVWFNLDDKYSDYNGNEEWYVRAVGTSGDQASINTTNTRVICN